MDRTEQRPGVGSMWENTAGRFEVRAWAPGFVVGAWLLPSGDEDLAVMEVAEFHQAFGEPLEVPA